MFLSNWYDFGIHWMNIFLLVYWLATLFDFRVIRAWIMIVTGVTLGPIIVASPYLELHSRWAMYTVGTVFTLAVTAGIIASIYELIDCHHKFQGFFTRVK